ncbi:hypothetical protein RMS29_025365 (plasmid) [Agrobacterium rosae]|uniref:Uncharacterized protein n=1 Tax=Agrobacterium rosae TaxID=1972867 RepID=A0ABU4W4A9_9HYPH|nr:MULTISPECIES: hypothetical protein [Agrobacterium]MDX8310895.1 hypothetical protein [Agrobacterium sp. rho-13.3]MDX8332604.1 hypothetical protein [Agrobacterium rosae]
MNFEDLATALEPPPNRAGNSDGTPELHLYEGAVMVAYAMQLQRTADAQHVRIHPDGEHGKQFDFAGWLLGQKFAMVSRLGTTAYGGVYRNPAGQTITVNPKSGLGDVVAEVGDRVISAECKGGIINTRHTGQVSRLYKGLCETFGLLMATPSQGRQVAVVPLTEGTLRLAERLAPRCVLAGIEIAACRQPRRGHRRKPARAAEGALGANGATDNECEDGEGIF